MNMIKNCFLQRGSLLIEMLLAILIAGIIIGAVSGLIFTSQKSGKNSELKGTAIALAQEGMEAMQSIGENNWHSIYLPPSGVANSGKGEAKDYFVYKNGSSWVLSENSSDGNITVNGVLYIRKIHIDNVNRDSSANREIVLAGGTEDHSTQKIKIIVSTSGTSDTITEEYLTRWKNRTFNQSNWSGGGGQAGPVVTPNNMFDSNPDGNIDIGTPGVIKLKQ